MNNKISKREWVEYMFIDHLIAFKASLNAQRNNQFVYNKRIGSVKTILGIVIKRLEKLAQFFSITSK